MTELSELIGDDVEPPPKVVILESSGDSIHSEPTPVTKSNKYDDYDPNTAVSDSDIPFDNNTTKENSNISSDGVTDLEYLVDSTGNDSYVPDSPSFSNADLEALLDDDENLDIDEDCDSLSLISDSRSVTSSRKFSACSGLYSDEDTVCDSSSDGYTSDDEIRELKAKHLRDMNELLKKQEEELHEITEQLRRAKLKNYLDAQKQNIKLHEVADYPSQTLNDLHEFIYETPRGNLNPLCI